MIRAILVGFLLTVGCSSATDDEKPLHIVVDDAGRIGADDVDRIGADAGDMDEQSEFGLRVSVAITTLNSQAPISIAVRETMTDEMILFERIEEGGEGHIDVPGLFSRGGSYEVGVTTDYAKCLSEHEDTFFAALDEVSEDIELTFTTEDAEQDLRGCDVLHRPLQMPAGRYAQPDGALAPGEAVILVVSETGRLYLKSANAKCNGGNACYPSLITAGFGTCRPWSARTPLPSETEFELYADNSNGSGSDPTELNALVVIDEEADVFRLTGETRTDIANGGGECCSRSLDFTMRRLDEQTYDCP